jgi:hypothetical protein
VARCHSKLADVKRSPTARPFDAGRGLITFFTFLTGGLRFFTFFFHKGGRELLGHNRRKEKEEKKRK